VARYPHRILLRFHSLGSGGRRNDRPREIDESTVQNDLVQKQLEYIETDDIEQYWQRIYDEYNGFARQ